jgi:hypothetical protein
METRTKRIIEICISEQHNSFKTLLRLSSHCGITHVGRVQIIKMLNLGMRTPY